MMTIDFDMLQTLFIGLLAFAIFMVLLATNRRHARMERRIADLEHAVSTDPVVGHRVAAALSERATIEQWRIELSKHPEGSPKHTAYLNRLREVGAL